MTRNNEGRSPYRARAYSMIFMRRIFWIAQGGICPICSSQMKRQFGSPKLTFDHVWPVSGVLAHPKQACIGNLFLTHEKCNLIKSNRQPTESEVEWLAIINRRLGYDPHETKLWDELELTEAHIE